jgi:predicted alpha/beta hydrolase family esterase
VQPDLFFHPWHDEDSYNQLLGEECFEEIRISNDGELIHGWIKYNTEQPKAPLLIFFGGNAQNSSNTCLSFFYNDKYKYFEGYNLMIIDYPGYGLSEGSPSDKTMFKTGLKIYDYASSLDCVDKDKIVILGYSIGTGVATYVSSQRSVNGLILLAPYDEALSLYNDNVNIFHGPVRLLARYKFKSIDYAKDVTVSPLIITSYDDEVISYKHSVNLAEYFENVDNLHILNNKVKHNDYFSQQEVLINIYDYLQNRL